MQRVKTQERPELIWEMRYPAQHSSQNQWPQLREAARLTGTESQKADSHCTEAEQDAGACEHEDDD